MGETLKFGAALNNGAIVLHYTPGQDGRAGCVFAFSVWDGQFVSWRTPRDKDGNLGSVELGRYFGLDFEKGWQVHCERAGISNG
ncbi:hypothetical protein SAMN05216275_10557 [Streptosporangium canum]|uniref:Uncharacterized protein n=1 Tax=Streptosporangium canum TaxID=324952 RepID=A0A1I3L9M7_9ACTN|nr:hypothetical protein [Streptosporangium canum]SFI81290.1 hypothetical protein SAMN05216275_10557 [Streptosporangium canum]